MAEKSFQVGVLLNSPGLKIAIEQIKIYLQMTIEQYASESSASIQNISLKEKLKVFLTQMLAAVENDLLRRVSDVNLLKTLESKLVELKTDVVHMNKDLQKLVGDSIGKELVKKILQGLARKLEAGLFKNIVDSPSQDEQWLSLRPYVEQKIRNDRNNPVVKTAVDDLLARTKLLFEQRYEVDNFSVELEKASHPSCFISYAWPLIPDEQFDESWTQRFIVKFVKDLRAAGVNAKLDVLNSRLGNDAVAYMEQGIKGGKEDKEDDYVIIFGTQSLYTKCTQTDYFGSAVFKEIELIKQRVWRARQGETSDHDKVLVLVLTGDVTKSISQDFKWRVVSNSFQSNGYLTMLKETLLRLYDSQVPDDLNRFEELWASAKANEYLQPLFKQGIDAAAVKKYYDQRTQKKVLQKNSHQLKSFDYVDKLFDKKTLSFAADKISSQALQQREFLLKKLTQSLELDQQNPVLAQALAYYVEPDVTDELIILADVNKRIPLLDKAYLSLDTSNQTAISKFLLDPIKRIFLVLGDSGSGKSLFCRKLQQQFWQQLGANLIPVVIELRKWFSDDALVTFKKFLFEEIKLDEDQIKTLKNEKFLIELDGYDEITGTGFPNLAIEKLFSEFPYCKVIITCRTQYLQNKNDYQSSFVPTYAHNNDKNCLQEVYLAPFTQEQIISYLKSYVKITQDSWDVDIYQAKLKEYPQLLELINNPLLLKLVIDVLKSFDKSAKVKTAQLNLFTRTNVYRTFIADWFNREARRIAGSSNTELKFPIGIEPEESFQDFSEKLAFQMFYLEGKPEVEYKPSGRRRVAEQIQYWDKFFSETDPEIIRKRAGCPLRKVGNSYSFIHKSFWEYFTACHFVFELGLDNPEAVDLFDENGRIRQNALDFNKKLLNSEPAILEFLAEMVIEYGEKAIDQLFKIIKASRTELNGTTFKVAAANAATVLNYAHISFADYDLSGVDISDAVLQGGLLNRVDLSNANLTRVNLQQAFLVSANLKNTIMKDVFFGELANLPQSDVVKSICSHPKNNNLLAIGLKDGKIIIHDLEKRKDIFSWQGISESGMHSGINCLEFSPDGEYLVSGGGDSAIRLWKIDSSVVLKDIFEGHTKTVMSVHFSLNGEFIVSSSKDQSIRMWDIQKKTEIVKFDDKVEVYAVHISADAKTIVSGGKDGYLRFWNVDTKEMSEIKGHEAKEADDIQIWDIRFSPDNKWVASASGNSQVCLFDTEKKFLKHVFLHTAWVRSVRFSSKGDFIVTGSSDRSVRIWDTVTGKLVNSFIGHTDEVQCVQFSANNHQIVSGSRDKTIRFYDLDVGRNVQMSVGHTGDIWNVKFSPDGEIVASSSWDNTIRLWTKVGRQICILKDSMGYVPSIVFSRDGKYLFSGSDDRVIRCWDIDKREVAFKLTGHTDVVSSLTLSPDGKYLLSGSGLRDRSIILWDLNSTPPKFLKAFHGHEGNVTCISFSPDGKQFISSGREPKQPGKYNLGPPQDKFIRLWDVATGELIYKFEGHEDNVRSVCYLDKNTIISGSMDNTIRVWDISTHETLYQLNRHTAGIRCLQLFKDPQNTSRQLLVSGSEDKTIRIWDLKQGKTLFIIKGFADKVGCISMNANNELVTGSWDHALRFWKPQIANDLKYILQWSTHAILACDDCDISNAVELSDANRYLLQQRNACQTLKNSEEPAKVLKLR